MLEEYENTSEAKNGAPELCLVLAWLVALLTGGTGAQSQNSNSSLITSYGKNIQVTQHISTYSKIPYTQNKYKQNVSKPS